MSNRNKRSTIHFNKPLVWCKWLITKQTKTNHVLITCVFPSAWGLVRLFALGSVIGSLSCLKFVVVRPFTYFVSYYGIFSRQPNNKATAPLRSRLLNCLTRVRLRFTTRISTLLAEGNLSQSVTKLESNREGRGEIHSVSRTLYFSS